MLYQVLSSVIRTHLLLYSPSLRNVSGVIVSSPGMSVYRRYFLSFYLFLCHQWPGLRAGIRRVTLEIDTSWSRPGVWLDSVYSLLRLTRGVGARDSWLALQTSLAPGPGVSTSLMTSWIPRWWWCGVPLSGHEVTSHNHNRNNVLQRECVGVL